MADVLGFEAALQLVLEQAEMFSRKARATEMVALAQARGRVLGRGVRADRDQPPFDRATRDGYAVRAADETRARRVVGSVRAGEAWGGGVCPGTDEAIEIMTGAPVPEAADAVVMLEHTARHGASLRIDGDRTPRTGQNVVRRGAELRAGVVAVAAGVRIGPAEMAVAASVGAAQLVVYTRPRVAVLATGDELVELEASPAAHQIRNSNGYAIAGLVEECGGLALRSPVVRDTREALREALAKASVEADLLLISGGVSAGKYDLVEEVLAECGATFHFTGVRMQPGKPLVFGSLGRAGGGPLPFFGLPGNPVSTQVTFACFAAPLLRAMGGDWRYAPQWMRARLGEAVPARPGLTRLLPAELTCDPRETVVRLVTWQGSGDAVANGRGHCYVLLPGGEEAFAAGDEVAVLVR